MSITQKSTLEQKLNTIEAIADIKAGKVVVVVDDEHRENEGDFIAAAESRNARNDQFYGDSWTWTYLCPR